MRSRARRKNYKRIMNNKNEIDPKWLSLRAACARASMSEKTLIFHIASGEIYGTKKGGKWYIDRDSIDDYFNADREAVRAAVARVLGAGV